MVCDRFSEVTSSLSMKYVPQKFKLFVAHSLRQLINLYAFLCQSTKPAFCDKLRNIFGHML